MAESALHTGCISSPATQTSCSFESVLTGDGVLTFLDFRVLSSRLWDSRVAFWSCCFPAQVASCIRAFLSVSKVCLQPIHDLSLVIVSQRGGGEQSSLGWPLQRFVVIFNGFGGVQVCKYKAKLEKYTESLK